MGERAAETLVQEPLDHEEEERDDSPYCDCGSFPDEEEQASNRCSCCGKMVDL